MKKNLLLKILSGLLFLFLAGGLYFVYGILPEKVAQSLVAKAKIHKPLTLDPGKYGLSYQAVATASDGVTLSGWWLPADKTKKPLGTILLTHGAFKNREQVFLRAFFLVKAGYQVLLFDQRGCGLSGDSPLSGGLLESKDFTAWALFVKKTQRLKKPLVDFGFSMGAMGALRDAVEDREVDGVVADSPLANLKSYVSRRTLGGRFSKFPGFLNRCLKAYDFLSGLNLTEGDLNMVPIVQQLREVPVIYITGEADDLAKSEEVRELFLKTSSHHRRLVYIPEAGHEETYDKYPIVYQKGVLEFLTALREGFPKTDDYSTQPIK